MTAYHLPIVWRLRGALDLRALRLALADLVERHPTLRTSFRLHGSEVLQFIHAPEPFPLEAESLGERTPDAVIEEWLEQERNTPFDLSAGLLLRARLLAVMDQHHLLLINHHHIASDGWSCAVLARDLAALYNARHSGRSPELQPLAVHYQDYAAWQRQRLGGDRLRRLEEYWIPQLTGLEPLGVPADRPRPATPSYKGDSVAFEIEFRQCAQFEALCRSEGATLQMGLLALLGLLLHRYSRQHDFAIGVPIWGRNHPDLEPLIGLFINTLPIRTRFEPQQSFRQLLQDVKATSLAAYDHQELPFEQMLEALNVERDTSRNPLVQVMLQFVEFPEAALHNLHGLAVDSLAAAGESAKLDLSFDLCRNADRGLQGSITYATDLFSRERIERLASHLLTLLSSALEAPDAAAASLRLLPAAEGLLIESWQQGPAIHVPELCVHQLFEQQTERTPDAVALVFGDQQLTYRELDTRANQWVEQLLDLGVGPEVVVAVCLERSVELVAALLAILKAGGAYLPIDPGWPEERRRLLLEQAACRVLLDRDGSTVLNGGRPADWGAPGPRLAYVAYTSGSTGKPKCVAITHNSILRLVDPANGFLLSAGQRVLQLAPVVFDAATFEIWGPLLNGGTLVVAPPEQLSLQALSALISQREITTLWFTAGLFHAMVETEVRTLAGVRQVLAGGDVLSPEHVRLLLEAFPPGHELINGYGPTENTTFTCCQRMKAGAPVDPAGVPIGRPIASTEVRVLDDHGKPCPIGVPGELHIGGAGLARGYLHDPELTAEKFIPDPRSADPAARLYKSGDLASWNPDGSLAFHGRIDRQIKLRGFRIEPGEIEAHLLAHPAVSRAVVLLRRDDPANPRLIAYWVAEDPRAGVGSTASEQLRSFIAERLPAYMVPSAFVQIETLPLTASGKLDRDSLPAPSRSGNREHRVEPVTDLERQLHGIWAELLGHRDFGVTDNFFVLGGHSLLTMRVDQLVRERLGLDVPLYLLFSHPTVSELARTLADGTSDSVVRNEPAARSEIKIGDHALPAPVQRVLMEQHYFLENWPGQVMPGHRFVRLLGETRSAHGLFWCFQGSHEHEALARHLSPAVRLYGMRSLHQTGDARVVYENPSLLAIVAGLYAREIADLAEADKPLIVGGNCQSAWVAHATARQLARSGADVKMLILMEVRMEEIANARLDWDGPVTLIWGASSSFNPFAAAHRPASRSLRLLKRLAPQAYRAMIRSRLNKAFRGGLEISIVPGVHGAFFRSENIEGLAREVKKSVVKYVS
jgi:amino acid adenylation domain-containing protein